jgi:hypothetical protein
MKQMHPVQWLANYGPQAKSGPLLVSVRPRNERFFLHFKWLVGKSKEDYYMKFKFQHLVLLAHSLSHSWCFSTVPAMVSS